MNKDIWFLRIRSEFSASHQLRHYGGKCEELHGHNFQVEVEVCGNQLEPDTGILIDFKVLKEHLQTVLDKLDHKHLNDLDEFREENPSSELLAKFIFKRMKNLLAGDKVKLSYVMVAEKDSSMAIYREDE
ncbi:6-carboxytetrahydropterin synthase QueD [Desulfovulcanus sp.]